MLFTPINHDTGPVSSRTRARSTLRLSIYSSDEESTSSTENSSSFSSSSDSCLVSKEEKNVETVLSLSSTPSDEHSPRLETELGSEGEGDNALGDCASDQTTTPGDSARAPYDLQEVIEAFHFHLCGRDPPP